MEEQPTQYQMPQGSFQMPLHQQNGSMILMTDPQEELYNIELTLKGLKQGVDGQLIEVDDPLMNDKGINAFIGILRSIVNRITNMSNITKEDRVNKLLLYSGETIIRDLLINKRIYGITSFSARERIHNMALNLIYLTLMRGFEEGEKRFWKGSVQEIHSTLDDRNARKGVLSKINPFSK